MYCLFGCSKKYIQKYMFDDIVIKTLLNLNSKFLTGYRNRICSDFKFKHNLGLLLSKFLYFKPKFIFQ